MSALSVVDLEPYAKILEALSKLWTPHPGQIAPGRDLFYNSKKRIALRFGRQTGKSQFCAFAAVRWALTKPKSQIFIIGPFLTQIRQIYLHSGIIRDKCPPEYLSDVHIADGRFNFTNGSSIKLLGADNYESARGLTADLVICDEIKEFKEEVWPVIYPLLLAKRAPLIISGTPPGEREHHYWDLMREAESNPDWAYYKLSTYDNPYIAKEDVDKERDRYERRGDLNTWTREYLAEYAIDEKRAVFPMFDKDVHVRPYAELLNHTLQRQNQWQFIVALDPGHASVFAGLLGAVNLHTGQVRFLDEVYATDQAATSVGAIWPLVQKKMDAIYTPDPHDEQQWLVVVDEAATGTRVELLDVFDINAVPTQKALNRKSYGIGMLKDLYLSKKLLIADCCVNFVSETVGYFLSPKGEYVKERDHLTSDAARYLLHAAYYTVKPADLPPDPEEIDPVMSKQRWTPEQDARATFGDGVDLGLMEDW